MWDPDDTSSGQKTSARWLTELLVVIARKRLVRKEIADEIRYIMSSEQPDLATGIYNRLTESEMESLSRQGKIGYLDKGPFADCAIIRRTTLKGTSVTYVAVALNGSSHDKIKEIGAELDDCILRAHGEPPKGAS